MASPPKTVSNLVFYSHLPDKYILQLILFFLRGYVKSLFLVMYFDT